MSGLDTRGFMDGALRAYDIADRHFERKEDRALRAEQMAKSEQRAEQEMSLRMAEEQRRTDAHAFNYGEDGQGGALRQAQALKEKEYAHSGKLRDAQIAQAESARQQNEYQLTQQKKTAFITENSPILQTGWQRFIDGGETDEIFDNELIKGSAYDPRRYLDPELNKAADVLEAKMPMVIKGQADFNDPELKTALTTFYKSNLNASVGQKDPKTGQVIKDARWGGMTFAKDINPEMDGDQPGIVITTEVNYGDDKWVPRPVTSRRSADADDTVKVIPLEQAMQDITGQLKLRRQAMVSPAYKAVFQTKDGEKDNKAIEKEYRGAYLEIEKKRSDALSNLMNPTPESQAEINSLFDEQQAKMKSLYFPQEGGEPAPKPTPFNQWAGNDANKRAFITALEGKYGDLSQFDEQTVARAYTDQVNKAKSAKAEQVAGQIRVDAAKQYASR
ncbi:hypothetical protein [Enterovibrio sp. 27052020O]|uniref:hypothetical protein n=1 Tax=Enterovibrio sp. 27052020O TaxID=3241166 RepID=UPI00388FAE6A